MSPLVIPFILLFLNTSTALAQPKGPSTEKINFSEFKHIIYVSKNDIYQAISIAKKIKHENEKVAILVATGDYILNETIEIPENIHLFGGFSNDGKWKRDITKYPTKLIGKENTRMLILSDKTVIDGFIIINAKFRGKGSAIYVNSSSPVISNNIFINNKTLSPPNWKPKYLHEIANDGGAIYCENGASPIIRNNIFAENQTETGRGGAIAFHNECNPIVINNIFINNKTGLNDPMRSSDGGAISLFKWCKGTIKNNIFLSNSALSKNDGGAIFAALWCSPLIKNNLFINNYADDDGGAIFTGGQEHRYDKPPDPIPNENEFYIKIINNIFVSNKTPKTSNADGAIRFTMNARGEFVNNITYYNNGLKFDNCEIYILENKILDDVSFEKKENNFGKFILKNNILLGKLNSTNASPSYENNILKNQANLTSDSLTLKIISSKFDPLNYSTKLKTLNQNFPKDIINRIVKANNKWGVIKNLSENYIEVWGNLEGISSICILPSFELKTKSNKQQ